MTRAVIQKTFLSCLAVLLFSLSSPLFASNEAWQDYADVRVHILSKYHPREITVVINGDAVPVSLGDDFPVVLGSNDGSGFTVQIPEQEVARNYRGRLEIRQRKGELLLINELPFMSYVASATIGESGWVEPEAMKAQAVLIATNVLRRQQQARRHADKLSDISDLAYHQVYPGHNRYVEKLLAVLKEMPYLPLLQTDPVDNRAGDQLQSKLVDAVFHAECGRRIFSAREIWGADHSALKSRFIDDDLPPGAGWQKNIRQEIIDRIFSVNAAEYVVQELDDRLVVRVDNDFYGIDDFRLMINRKLGWNTIESNDFEIRALPGEIIFSGYGRGHGVGLCQVQSNFLAQKGWKFRDILSYFYPAAILL
ncbi:MAG: hypothetical protein GY697_19345 [Desulfobacterales bacterium]|nr:hypothetical protein [Desulfobacterales bacterium]